MNTQHPAQDDFIQRLPYHVIENVVAELDTFSFRNLVIASIFIRRITVLVVHAPVQWHRPNSLFQHIAGLRAITGEDFVTQGPPRDVLFKVHQVYNPSPTYFNDNVALNKLDRCAFVHLVTRLEKEITVNSNNSYLNKNGAKFVYEWLTTSDSSISQFSQPERTITDPSKLTGRYIPRLWSSIFSRAPDYRFQTLKHINIITDSNFCHHNFPELVTLRIHFTVPRGYWNQIQWCSNIVAPRLEVFRVAYSHFPPQFACIWLGDDCKPEVIKSLEITNTRGLDRTPESPVHHDGFSSTFVIFFLLIFEFGLIHGCFQNLTLVGTPEYIYTYVLYLATGKMKSLYKANTVDYTYCNEALRNPPFMPLLLLKRPSSTMKNIVLVSSVRDYYIGSWWMSGTENVCVIILTPGLLISRTFDFPLPYKPLRAEISVPVDTSYGGLHRERRDRGVFINGDVRRFIDGPDKDDLDNYVTKLLALQSGALRWRGRRGQIRRQLG